MSNKYAHIAFDRNLHQPRKSKFLSVPWEFVVIDPTPLPIPKTTDATPIKQKRLVDSISCVRQEEKAHSFRGNGTSTIIDAGAYTYRQTGGNSTLYYYERTGGKLGKGPWIRRSGHPKRKPGYRSTYVKDIDWFAYTLDVKNPETTHLISLWLPTDKYRRVSAQAIDHVTGHYNGIVAEVFPTESGELSNVVFPFWPNSKQFDLVFYATDAYHGSQLTESAISKIELFEFPQKLPALRESACGWNPDRETGWGGEQLNLGAETRATPRLWQGDSLLPEGMKASDWKMGMFYDYKAFYDAWKRFGEYARYRGDNFLMWPVHTYNMVHIRGKLFPRGEDAFSKGYGYRPIDKYPRETLKLILLLCEKYGVNFFAQFRIHHHDLATFKKFVATSENVTEEQMEGFIQQGGWPKLNPCHPVARSFLKRLYGEIAAQGGGSPAFRGVVQRNWGAGLMGGGFQSWEEGYGDYTIAKFANDTGIKVPTVPKGGNKYEFRRHYLIDSPERREKWFRWRADQVASLQNEIVNEMRKYSPNATLFLSDQKVANYKLGLGWDGVKNKSQRRKRGYYDILEYSTPGVEVNDLDPMIVQNFDIRKGIKKSENPLDKLEYKYCYPFGMCTGSGLTAPPFSTRKLAHDLAKNPVDMLMAGGFWCFPMANEQTRQWIQTWRAIPSLHFKILNTQKENQPVVCWQAKDKNGKLVCYLVNTTGKTQNFTLECGKSFDVVENMVTRETIAENAEKLNYTLAPFALNLLAFSGIGEIKSIAFPSRPKATLDLEKERISFMIENPGAIPRDKDLVVLTGKNVLDRINLSTGETIDVRRLQIWNDGVPIPTQVDEKNDAGDYVSTKNQTLEPNDEIVFQLSFAKGERSKKIELGLNKSVKKEDTSSFVITTQNNEKPDSPWEVLVNNGLVEAGFGSAQTHTSNAGLTFLKSKDTVLFQSRPKGYEAFMPVDWPIPAASPEVVANGPVRCIVRISFPQSINLDWHFEKIKKRRYKREGFLDQAQMKRLFQMTVGKRTVKQIYNIRYDKTSLPRFYWSLIDMVKIQEMGGGEIDDKMVISSWRDKVKTYPWNIKKTMADRKKNDLWMAVWDQKKNFGLALIMEPATSHFWHSGDWGRGLYRNDHLKINQPGELSFATWVIPLSDGDPQNIFNQRNAVLNPLRLRMKESK